MAKVAPNHQHIRKQDGRSLLEAGESAELPTVGLKAGPRFGLLLVLRCLCFLECWTKSGLTF